VVSVVAHPEHADRPAPESAVRKPRLLEQHQDVEWATIFAKRAGDEAVVGGIGGCLFS
jgi:hypothetical protein